MTKVMPSRWWAILVWPPESQHSQGGQRSGLDSMWKEFHWGWGGRTHGPGWSQTHPDELRNLEPGVWCRWCPEPSTSWQSHSPTYKPTEEHPDICSYHVNNKLFVMMVGAVRRRTAGRELTFVVSTPPYLALTLGSWMVSRLVPVTVRVVLPLSEQTNNTSIRRQILGSYLKSTDYMTVVYC